MSTVYYEGYATFVTPAHFDADAFCISLAEQCAREGNFIAEEYGIVDDRADVDFTDYIQQALPGATTLVSWSTDGGCGNSTPGVFEWVLQQMMQATGVKWVKVHSISADTDGDTQADVSVITSAGEELDITQIIDEYMEHLYTAEV